MCCFSRPVQRVSGTRIFCRLSGQDTQFVSYQMEYKSEVPNAMILPVPTQRGAQEDAVRFIDLSGYDQFFDDLAKGFPAVRQPPMAVEGAVPASRSAKLLVVQEVGDFVASFVPSMDDFDRLDPQFVIPADVWSQIPEYADYGFVVFQLKNLEGKPHPMAFEFPTRLKDKIFFPTVHIHDGEVHEFEEFDHTLYLQDAAFDERVGGYTRQSDPATSLVRSKHKAGGFVAIDKAKGIVDGERLVHRRTLEGRLANTDVIVKAAQVPSAVSANFPSSWMWAPVAAAAVSIGWIIDRRNRLRGARHAH